MIAAFVRKYALRVDLNFVVCLPSPAVSLVTSLMFNSIVFLQCRLKCDNYFSDLLFLVTLQHRSCTLLNPSQHVPLTLTFLRTRQQSTIAVRCLTVMVD